MKYVEVAVNLPGIRGTFDYHLPAHLVDRVAPGHLVRAPFGRRTVQGIVTATPKEPAVEQTRSIEALLDPLPVLTTAQLDLARWLSTNTLTPLIDCLTLMLPPGVSQKADSLYRLLQPEAEGGGRTQARLIALLRKRGELRGRQIARALPHQAWRRAADALLRRGVIERMPVLEPPRTRSKRARTVRLSEQAASLDADLTPLGRTEAAAARRRRMLEALRNSAGTLDASELYRITGGSLADLRRLAALGLVELGERITWRDPLSALHYVPSKPPTLTSDQARVWQEVLHELDAQGAEAPRPLLLHGVTGSGKTEIYLRAVEHVLARGQQAIVLVPEIALTPQTVNRFLARFGNRVGVSHSQLSPGERYDTWQRCRLGELKLIIGARSALFAPFSDIGLIVLDESHDDSYKEHARAPRYHARETALAYAKRLGACCILGSATPDVVTYYRSERGRIRRLELPQRIFNHREQVRLQAQHFARSPAYRPAGGDAQQIDLPPVRVVDMRLELKAGNRSIFSRPLVQALEEVFASREQAILFLNRRGAATYVFCRDCGWVARCPRCDTPLTYHRDQDRLRCHHCGYQTAMPRICPQCGGGRVRQFGAGTQQVEAELKRLFPHARPLRWDRDATRTRGAHHAILQRFSAQEADVLIGTQMLAKGLDLPLVTLVGVISADTALNLPDYRAGERSFQVLMQVAGRAGRGILGGRVILQTYAPDHYAVQAAAKHNFEAFYRHELRLRRDLGYPPFQRLVRLLLREVSVRKAQDEAERMAAILQKRIDQAESTAALIGPAPCFFERVRGLYRWQIVLRGRDPVPLIPEAIPAAWSVDVDPVSLL